MTQIQRIAVGDEWRRLPAFLICDGGWLMMRSRSQKTPHHHYSPAERVLFFGLRSSAPRVSEGQHSTQNVAIATDLALSLVSQIVD